MDDPLFVLHPNRSTLPYRDRELAAPLAQRFTTSVPADGEPFELLVRDDVAEEVRRLAERSHPNEWFGLLLGRSFHDNLGEYTIVVATVSPPSFTSARGHFHVDQLQSAAAAREALERHPMLDTVGWWHSHAAPSGYSLVDRTEQRSWHSPHQVGLLVFASGAPWAVAYQGPDARPLELAMPDAHVQSAAAPPHDDAGSVRSTSGLGPAPSAQLHFDVPSPMPGGWGEIASPAETARRPDASAEPLAPDGPAAAASTPIGWWWWAAIAASMAGSLTLAALATISR